MVLFGAFSAATALAIAPQAALQQKLTDDTPVAYHYYGACVAISGDTALVPCVWETVGSHPEAGAVFVYARTAGVWSEQAVLTEPTAALADNDHFGKSVALYGDTAVVGAIGVGSKTGAAYVYSRTGTTWTNVATLTASDGVAGDQFGSAVALSGNAILVTADTKSVAGNTDAGEAYVFRGGGSSWSQEASLLAPSPATNDYFGEAAALSGDTALIGAPDQAGNTGAAYVFTRSGTTWSTPTALVPTDAVPNSLFGTAVALDGDTALVGALGATVGSQTGAAYAFVGSGPSWTQQQEIAEPASHSFGAALALDGDTAVIGADTEAVAGAPAGAAYIYARTGSTWWPRGHVTDPDQAGLDYFGCSVAFSGTTVLVGSAHATVAGLACAGAAFTYLLDSTPPATTASGLHSAAAGPWQRVAARVSLSAADDAHGAGLSATWYTVDAGTQQVYAAPFILNDGSHAVTYWSVDRAGNVESVHVGYVNVDERAPKVSAKALTVPAAKAGKGKSLKLHLTVVDPRPGCGTATVVLVVTRKGKRLWSLTCAGRPTDRALTVSYKLKRTLARGTYSIAYRATDAAGNRQAKATTVRLRVS